jgi:hypothetical protein
MGPDRNDAETRRNGETEIRGQRSEDRDSLVGAAFSRDLTVSTI